MLTLFSSQQSEEYIFKELTMFDNFQLHNSNFLLLIFYLRT
jgi:hypothetical protein